MAYLSTNLGACIIFPFSAVVHMAMGNCMDAIRLNGNIWINIPLCPGKLVSGMTARCERAVKGDR